MAGRAWGEAGSLPRLSAWKIYHLGGFLLFREGFGGEVAQNIGVINALIAEFKQRMQGSTYTAHSTVVPTGPRELPSMWVQCPDFTGSVLL